MQVKYRAAKAEDAALIMDSWLKSWRTSAWAGTVPNHLYFETQRTTIEQLLLRGAKFEVAVASEHPDLILGWACHELTQDTPPRTIIHYVYVKDPYLKLPEAIGETLARRAPGVQPGYYTHRYRTVVESLPGRDDWRHAPEIARREATPEGRRPSSKSRRRRVAHPGAVVHPTGETSGHRDDPGADHGHG